MKDTTCRNAVSTPPAPLDLDGLYGPQETATWMRLKKRTLLDLVRLNRIPVVRLNERVLRFHPRTILARQGMKVV